MAPFTHALPPNSWGARLTASGHGVCARGQRARGTQKRDAQESATAVRARSASRLTRGPIAAALRRRIHDPDGPAPRCRRHARRAGRDVVARLGGGVVAFKFGASWRLRIEAGNDPALRPCRRRRSPSGYRPAWQIASSAALPRTRARQLGGNGPAVLRVFAFFPGKFE